MQLSQFTQELCDFYEVNVFSIRADWFCIFLTSQFCCSGDYKEYYYIHQDE